MADIKAIIDILKHNKEIAQRFFEIEKRILSILAFTDFFEVLLTEIRRQFKVPYAWITIIRNSEIDKFIQTLDISDRLRLGLNIVSETDFVNLVGTQMTPLLLNQGLESYQRFLPRNSQDKIRSIAIAPISLDGKIIGSLNQGDLSAQRFKPGMDTSLLEQLSVKVSLCLSNVTAHEKLRAMAYYDHLTGLLNRRVMESVLSREFSNYQRYHNNFSLIFVDLDYFKQINDVYGHDCGDDLLVYVAQNLLRMSRVTDIVSRYAGDEFVLILPKTTKESAQQFMRRVCNVLSQHPLKSKGQAIAVSISFGIATPGDDGVVDPDSLVKMADKSLYKAKNSRKAPLPFARPTAIARSR